MQPRGIPESGWNDSVPSLALRGRGHAYPRPEYAMTEETIFAAALEKADPPERAAYLEAACTDDAALRPRARSDVSSVRGLVLSLGLGQGGRGFVTGAGTSTSGQTARRGQEPCDRASSMNASMANGSAGLTR